MSEAQADAMLIISGVIVISSYIQIRKNQFVKWSMILLRLKVNQYLQIFNYLYSVFEINSLHVFKDFGSTQMTNVTSL